MKDKEIILCIETFDAANGGGVGWYKDKGAYHLYLLATEAPIARPEACRHARRSQARLLVTPAKMGRYR